MRFTIAFIMAVLIGGLSPAMAQVCGDDIAGLSVDDEGNYVMETPKAAARAKGSANTTNICRIPPAKAAHQRDATGMAALRRALTSPSKPKFNAVPQQER
jgi:hypothetical protein